MTIKRLDRILSELGVMIALPIDLFGRWPDAKQDAIFLLLLSLYMWFRSHDEDKKPE